MRMAHNCDREVRKVVWKAGQPVDGLLWTCSCGRVWQWVHDEAEGGGFVVVSVPLYDAYVQGWKDADQAFARNSNPYPKGTDLHEWWDAGWSRSGDELCGA